MRDQGKKESSTELSSDVTFWSCLIIIVLLIPLSLFGLMGCSDEILDVLRIWCSIIENQQSLDSLFIYDYSDEFKEIITNIRENSFKSQIEYLEKVFNIIDKNDNELINGNLKKNEKSSYEWCIRFNVPIYEKYLAEASHSGQLVFSQQ